MLILSTAHPCKFSETVHHATGVEPKIPENIKNILNQKESYITLDNNLGVIKNYILERIKEI
jgi:threonine synthase